jgi:hypothetical protein
MGIEQGGLSGGALNVITKSVLIPWRVFWFVQTPN